MKKINFKLINSIIKTDFFILENKKIENFNLIHKNTKYLTVLDIIQLNTQLKQFLRILQFVKKNNVYFNIYLKNEQFSEIFKQSLQKNFNFCRFNTDLRKINNKNFNNFEFYLSIDMPNNASLSKKNGIFSQINTKKQPGEQGVYKLFNSLDSFKKLLFIISIIKNTLKKKNAISK